MGNAPHRTEAPEFESRGTRSDNNEAEQRSESFHPVKRVDSVWSDEEDAPDYSVWSIILPSCCQSDNTENDVDEIFDGNDQNKFSRDETSLMGSLTQSLGTLNMAQRRDSVAQREHGGTLAVKKYKQIKTTKLDDKGKEKLRNIALFTAWMKTSVNRNMSAAERKEAKREFMAKQAENARKAKETRERIGQLSHQDAAAGFEIASGDEAESSGDDESSD
jgi:hypothetical protein